MKRFLKILLIVITVASLMSSAAISIGALYLSRYSTSRVDEELLKNAPYSTKTEFYYFAPDEASTKRAVPKKIEGAYLDNGIKYKYTSFGEMPDNLIHAFIAIEDKRFYDHSGIDLLRSGKAVVSYVLGDGGFGGSTITQQLVKNITGRDEITVDRKITEAFCALRLEQDLDKSEILEQYLNVINLSEGCRGVGAAAELFYSKQVGDLTLSESATIAAITNNPSIYDPIKHPENNMKRRNTVLRCMYEQNYITQAEYEDAVNQPISLNLSVDANKKINSWYIDMVTEDVINDLCEKYGLTPSSASLMIYRGGFKIYTAMDADIQEIVEGYYSDEYNFPIDDQGNQAQSAMIVIDPYTGDILGVAGAIGVKRGNRLQSFATNTKRPPGSTIKPLSVYAPALDKGLISWSSQFDDSPVIPETDKSRAWPQNVDRKYVGQVDVKYAIEHSLNTVAVKVLDLVGADNSMNFLKNKLMLSSLDEKLDMGPASLALGQPTKGVTLRELTAAYSIFQEGIMSKTRSYYKVTDATGRIILDNMAHEETVISRESAAIMTKLLQSVVDSGTAAGKISLDNLVEVAGKSGTSSNNCDRFFIGYTPEILAGVWFGYEYPKNLEAFGGNLSVYIWDDVISEIYQKTERYKKTSFTVPDTVQKLTYKKPDTIQKNDGGLPEHTVDNGWFNIKFHKDE